MRNGNIRRPLSRRKCIVVLTVPMRNGNISLSNIWYPSTSCSYRTYEEWKLCSCIRSHRGNECSYRTYEEWKHQIDKHNAEILEGSYRTYEEWKHYLVGGEFVDFCVLTVPMRNGNICLAVVGFSQYLVLTVPMRNGNTPENKTAALHTHTFLPYLWGMETLVTKNFVRLWIMFLPYLWGMETLQWCVPQWKDAQFLPYLWGMETHITLHCWWHVRWFLPYLWGMETDICVSINVRVLLSSYRTYEEWKLMKKKSF